jgi:hypothetical protein
VLIPKPLELYSTCLRSSGYHVIEAVTGKRGRLQATAKLNSDRMLAAADRVFGQPPKQLRKVTAVAQDTWHGGFDRRDYNWRQRMAL